MDRWVLTSALKRCIFLTGVTAFNLKSLNTKVLPYVIFGLAAAYYAYRTVKAALNDPPEETREYDCYTAEVLDSEDSWFDFPEDCNG